MKKILLAGFAGLCVFGALTVSSNSSGTLSSSARTLQVAISGDTTVPKKDTTEKELSKFVTEIRIANDTTPPQPDTTKLVAYIR
jgi:hypothetical protein